MAKVVEWRANTTGNPTYFTTVGWGNLSCGHGCWGVLEYIYSTFWRCRTCGRWHSIVPKARA